MARKRRMSSLDAEEIMFARKNPVAKNMPLFNQPVTHRDRKAAAKRGYTKHKGNIDG